MSDTVWSLVDFGDDKAGAEKSAPASLPKVTKPAGECPHCGKKLGRGGHFHIKACAARGRE